MLLNLNLTTNELMEIGDAITKRYMISNCNTTEHVVYKVIAQVLSGKVDLSYVGIRRYLKNEYIDKMPYINIFRLYSYIVIELEERNLIKINNDNEADAIRDKIKEICFSKMTRKGYDSLVKTLNETKDENLEVLFDFVIRMADNFERN